MNQITLLFGFVYLFVLHFAKKILLFFGHNYPCLIALILAFASNYTYALPTYLLHKKYEDRSTAIDSVFKTNIRDLDSVYAFKVLEEWQKMAENAADEELVLEMRFLKLKYYSNGKQPNYVLYEKGMQAFMMELNPDHLVKLKAKAHQEMAYYYYRIAQDFGKAFDIFFETHHLLSSFTYDNFPLRQKYLYDYGIAFYLFDDYKNALMLLNEADIPQNDDWLKFHINNTRGLIYRKQNNYNLSNLYFNRACQLGVVRHDSVQIAIALGNLGHNYFLQKQFSKAIPLLELDVFYCSKNREPINAAIALIKLAQISFINQNLSLSKQQCVQALEWLKSEEAVDYAAYIDAYKTMANIHALEKNMAVAYAYADSTTVAKDSFNSIMNAQILFKANRKIEADKHKTEMQTLENERAIQVLSRNSLLIILLLLSIITLLIYNRSRLTFKQKQLQLLTQKHSVEKELASATNSLKEYAQTVFEKSEKIEYLKQVVDEQTTEVVQILQVQKILTDAEWADFRLLFEKAHVGYLQRLKEKFPDLTQAEIRFIVLAKLGFSTKQMAATLGITNDAIRMMRYRLRKKFNLNESENLNDLILSV